MILIKNISIAVALLFPINNAFAWTCDDFQVAMRYAASDGFMHQDTISKTFGGDGSGFCGTTCLVIYEQIVAHLTQSRLASDPLERALDIVAELRRRNPNRIQKTTKPEELHHFVGEINNQVADGMILHETNIRDDLPRGKLINYQVKGDLEIKDVMGTAPNDVRLSIIAMVFYAKESTPVMMGGHAVIAVPIKFETNRVRIIDPRFPDEELLATIAMHPNGSPQILFDRDSWYRSYYQKIFDEELKFNQPLGYFGVFGAVSVRQN